MGSRDDLGVGKGNHATIKMAHTLDSGAEVVVVGAIPDDLRAWRGKTKATKSTTRAGQWQNTMQVIYGS